MRFVQLAVGNPLYVVKWEVATLRSHKTIVKHDTDKWVQPSERVKWVALWVCIRDFEQMRDSNPVATEWNPEYTANPYSPVLMTSAVQ